MTVKANRLVLYFAPLKNNRNRPGFLVDAEAEFNFQLIKHIILNYPKNRVKYKKLLESKPELFVLHIKSMRELKK